MADHTRPHGTTVTFVVGYEKTDCIAQNNISQCNAHIISQVILPLKSIDDITVNYDPLPTTRSKVELWRLPYSPRASRLKTLPTIFSMRYSIQYTYTRGGPELGGKVRLVLTQSKLTCALCLIVLTTALN